MGATPRHPHAGAATGVAHDDNVREELEVWVADRLRMIDGFRNSLMR